MRSLPLIAAAAAALLLTAACDPARPVGVERAAPERPANVRPAPANDHEGHPEIDAPRITLADAKKDYDSKAAVFIDTHGKEQFDAEHIAGAINLPANRLDEHISKIPKGKKLVLYCS